MKTSELIGPALDWAVAKCEGYTDVRKNPHRFANELLVMTAPRMGWGVEYLTDLDFSTDWSQGGPIIEREGISVQQFDGSSPAEQRWNAYLPGEIPVSSTEEINGPTPLIAAMRCYVASKLGDKVEIPEELQ